MNNLGDSLMWICLNDAFFSIVAHRDEPESLLVRARREGDIEKYWPLAKSWKDDKADYHYRAVIPRYQVSGVLSDYLMKQLNYDNFKNSVSDQGLHHHYSNIWSSMTKLQYE